MSGKTSFIQTLKDGKFPEPAAQSNADEGNHYSRRSTTSDQDFNLSLNVDGKERQIKALVGGRVASGGRVDRTYQVIPKQFDRANAILVCFDTSNQYGLRRSFRLLQLAQRDAAIYGTPVFLVGLQSDKRFSKISFEDAQREANEHLCDSYFECSAKTGDGVNNVITAVFHELDAITARDGAVPTIPSFDIRKSVYQKQRDSGIQPTMKKAVPVLLERNSLKQVPVNKAQIALPAAHVYQGQALQPIETAPLAPPPPPFKANVLGGARPAKQAAPCVLQ